MNQDISRELRNRQEEVRTQSEGRVTFCHILVICHIPMTNFSHARSRPVWAVNERMRSLRPKWGSSKERLGSAFWMRSSDLRWESEVEPLLPGWCLSEQIESVCVSDPDASETLFLQRSSGYIRVDEWPRITGALPHPGQSWSPCRRSRHLVLSTTNPQSFSGFLLYSSLNVLLHFITLVSLQSVLVRL